MIVLTDKISLCDNEISFDFVHSSGPGGQHVNKVATAVKLYFDAANSSSLPDDVKRRLIRIAGRRITKEGILIIDARQHRTQYQNRLDAMERLSALVRKAEKEPKKRTKTNPTRQSQERRLKDKVLRGKIKKIRQSGDRFNGME
jgi:ribosome-associated protein